KRVGASGHSLVAGIGDEAAVLRSTPGKETVITADLLIEDNDFRQTTHPAFLLGHKALAVSLSDIAAMGARPLWSMVSLAIRPDIWDSDFVAELYKRLLGL